MVRDLIDDWRRRRRVIQRHGEQRSGPSTTIVSAEMIGDCLGGLVHDWSSVTGAEAEHVVVQNGFFGSRVRVSGLLTGGDIIRNAGRYAGDIVVLPTVMLDKTGSRTIDGMTPAELRAAIGKPVHFAAYMSEVDRLVFEGSTLQQTA
jgi:NifB/MoaA-like Fe-S oxidoreductase